MEYSVHELAALSGVSTRTLRYYDQLGILPPKRTNAAGYRLYGRAEVDLLQQILFFREMGFALKEIGRMLQDEQFDRMAHMRHHKKRLLEERARISRMLRTLDKSMKEMQGGEPMQDYEKFEGLKKRLIDENEETYGREVREKYGDAQVDASNKKFQNMNEATYQRAEALAQEILTTLHTAMQSGGPESACAQHACALHKEWLMLYWDTYTKEAHAGLGRMYVDDPRFAAYYDKEQPGTAQFLCDALQIFTGQAELHGTRCKGIIKSGAA